MKKISLTNAHHLIDLKPNQRQGVRRPAIRALGRRGRVRDLLLVTVQGQLRVVVLAADDGPRALRLAGADVEEAELVPQQAADVGLERREAVLLAVPVQAHCSNIGS